MNGLTPEQIRSFLKDNVTVVAPGETLVIQANDMTPGQVRELQDWLNWADGNGPVLPFRTVVVPGEGLGMVGAETDDQFAARVAKALTSPQVRKAIQRERMREGRTYRI